MLPFLIPVTVWSIMCLCYPLFFLLLVFLFSIPMLHCNATECLEEGFVITNDTSDSILVSPGGLFEFGFFTPDGNYDNIRYLGIWYYNHSNPKVVVWVANRDKPLFGHNSSLVIEHGRAKVLDGKGMEYWSTTGVLSGQVQTFGPPNSSPTSNVSNLASPDELLHLSYENFYSPPTGTNKLPSISTTLCLQDNGNLVLDVREHGNKASWQSFAQPTDTFLPGMSIDGTLLSFSSIETNGTSSLNLTSWQNHSNPAEGNFSFLLQLGTTNNWVIVESGHSHYWESRRNPFDKNASALSGNSFLQNGTLTRLVMNYTGQIQFWKWESERGWSLKWSEPEDRCSLYNVCGEFGSCNSNNAVLCKCLPGFQPSKQWISGDTTGGCSPISGFPSNRNNTSSDIFFPLPMMTVGNETCGVSPGENCTKACLEDSSCVAYSYGFDCSGTGSLTDRRCLIWKDLLTDLQEESPDGITIYLRTTPSDIGAEPTSRGCSPCGTYIIPYPLSTGINCGDPSYINFHCNNETGQVRFSTPNGNFRVSSIDSDAKTFSIQVMHANSCDSRYVDSSVLSLKQSLLFTAKNCSIFKDQPLVQVPQNFAIVEIGWQPPPEPLCNVSSDCNHWSHTTCKPKNGESRCICESNFLWDGLKLECTRGRRVRFPLKVVLPCIAGALAIFLVCVIYFVYHTRKKRMAKEQGSFEFKGDAEGIDVPFFDWENIFAATNNFADANRLGTGGFGSVYRGKLPDGQDFAVKRLSSVSVQGVEEFRTEVMLIAKLQHRNLVRLIGYCMKADEKILVYEYMPNGSLDSCLFDEKHYVYLDWKKRFDIILGIARGLLYLHQDSRLRIIHRDLKPSNILLDEELNPKISDFGIARIVGGKETHASTNRVVGTYGYMSPEYALHGIFSIKSDIFSFGVVILETISGRRNSKIFMFEHGLSLPGHAWKLWNEDKGLELMDPKLKESCCPPEFLKCIHIGLLCVQEDPSDRPTMSTIVHMLSGENASLPPAKQPAFMNQKPLSENASSSSAMDSSVLEVMTVSTVGR